MGHEYRGLNPHRLQSVEVEIPTELILTREFCLHIPYTLTSPVFLTYFTNKYGLLAQQPVMSFKVKYYPC